MKAKEPRLGIGLTVRPRFSSTGRMQVFYTVRLSIVRLAWLSLTALFVPYEILAFEMSQSLESRLLAGELVFEMRVPKGGDGVSFVAYKRIEIPPHQIWPVVRDCQHYESFMPRTSESARTDCKGQTCICHSRLAMPFPLSDLWSKVKTTMSSLPGGGYERVWVFIEGTYHHNEGAWRVYPWPGEATATLLVYEVDLNPQISLPDFILRDAQTGALPEMFVVVAKRAMRGVPLSRDMSVTKVDARESPGQIADRPGPGATTEAPKNAKEEWGSGK